MTRCETRRPLLNFFPMLWCCLVLLLLQAPQADAHILDMRTGSYVSFQEMINDLEQVRLVFVGEMHDNRHHHQAQLQVIRELMLRGRKVAIGLEMFRSGDQPALERWIRGEVGEQEFLPIFERNWSMWPVYRDIFHLAKQHSIPMLGLNIDRTITRKISERGFAALTSQELESLQGVACDVDDKYQNYLRRSLGKHHGTNKQFLFFCEAQMVWDTVMAQRLIEYLQDNPDTTVVVLAGGIHAWKHGIPTQVNRRQPVTYRVLLPEVPERTELGRTTSEETDYLLLGVEEAPLH